MPSLNVTSQVPLRVTPVLPSSPVSVKRFWLADPSAPELVL